MIITVSGLPGAGKSAVAKFISKEFGLRHYSIGDFMGEIAVDRGLSLMELSMQAEKNDEIDKILDEKQINIGKKNDNFVIDSRLGWKFIPHAFKIFLKCDPDVGAERIFGTNRHDEKENTSIEATKQNLIRRIQSENQRYKEYYNIDDQTDEKHYDFVLDTSNLSFEEVCKIVADKIKENFK